MNLLSKTASRISEIQKINREIRQVQSTLLKGGLIPDERDKLWAKIRELKAKREEIAKSQSAKVQEYLRDLVLVGRKHGFVLSHEDSGGAFVVESRSDQPEVYERWLLNAVVPKGKV